jgi:hypothetical protein
MLFLVSQGIADDSPLAPSVIQSLVNSRRAILVLLYRCDKNPSPLVVAADPTKVTFWLLAWPLHTAGTGQMFKSVELLQWSIYLERVYYIVFFR